MARTLFILVKHLNLILLFCELKNSQGYKVHILIRNMIVYVTTTVTPRSQRYGDVTTTYIRRSEIPSHIYILSINIGKNQSTKVRGALYIPSYEYN